MFAKVGSGQVARRRLMASPVAFFVRLGLRNSSSSQGLSFPPPVRARMSRKKISTTIYVTPEQSERLRLLHERTKVPVAVYIREGIDLVLREYEHLLPGQLPLGADAAPSPPDAKAPALRTERGAAPADTPSGRAVGSAAGKG